MTLKNKKEFGMLDILLVHSATDNYLLNRKEEDKARPYHSVMRFGIETYYELLSLFAKKRTPGTKETTFLEYTAKLAYPEADKIIEKDVREIAIWLESFIKKQIEYSTGDIVKTYLDLKTTEVLSLTVYANAQGHAIKTDGKSVTVPVSVFKQWQKEIPDPFTHLYELPVFKELRAGKKVEK